MTPTNDAKIVKLAPSDTTFLWEQCRRCFWLKVNGVLRRPSAPFPKVFTLMDGLTKDHYQLKRTEELAPQLRPGRVAFGDRWVRSTPLEVPGHTTRIAIAGKIDTALSFDDGSWGIVDFKTSTPKATHVPFYGRQLHSYALAAENPAPGALNLFPVSQLGLLCIEPVAMVGLDDDVAFRSEAHWLEIERDDDSYLAFLAQILYVLENPEPPDPDPKCSYCTYLTNGSLVLLTGSYGQ